MKECSRAQDESGGQDVGQVRESAQGVVCDAMRGMLPLAHVA